MSRSNLSSDLSDKDIMHPLSSSEGKSLKEWGGTSDLQHMDTVHPPSLGRGKTSDADISFSDSDKSTDTSSTDEERLSREERLQLFMDTFTEEELAMFIDKDNSIDEDGCHSMTFREFCSYQLDMMESEGFDMEDYSKISDFGVIVHLHYPPDDPADDTMLTELEVSSRLAIKQFNKAQKTKFRNVVVLKANVEPLCPCRYYITFQATDNKNNSQVFQARVNVNIPTTKKDVELVRIKTAPKLFRPSKSSHRE